MHSLRGKRGLFSALALALATAMALPSTASAGPDKSASRANGRYRLFAGNTGAITINRVYYGLSTKGEVGVDSLNSSTIGGGYWPKGSGNQYMFNSGLQVAGIITGGAENPWAGDTTGGMFFDASGLRQHGTAVSEIYNSVSPVDAANWPQAAYVPTGDASEELFDDLLRGRLSASQGDVWFMTSEADPGLNAARPHPLGIIAEYRVLGWNFPTGNEDLLYLIVTFYNITTSDPAAYAQYRPGLRETLIEQAALFQQQNNASFDITLPAGGYTIDPFYAAFAADPDITATGSGVNFSSVNMPFAMGYAYHRDFARAAGWTFSPDMFGPPFFAGTGFVGIKYLKSATGPGEIALFSNTTNGGAFPDPNSAVRLYKYMSGTITPADGVSCNMGNPLESRICYIGQTTAADVRMMQSSTPMALAAGQSASIVVSYIHAAPVQIPGYVGGTAVLPGDPRRLSDVAQLTAGANKIDSLMGFAGFTDGNGDGIVQQDEVDAVGGSLLDKAKLAQTIFNNKFLLPFAPEAPEFFLIPGDHSVTVIWRPSASETTGDPFFEVAKDFETVPEGGGAPVQNAIYDPNYRKFDVEGYRIYRGRADTPTSLRLIAQFDYAGTSFVDYTGQVAAQGVRCAPELGVTGTCANVFDPQVAGPQSQLVRNVSYNLTGNFVQIPANQRALLASGDVTVFQADTAVVGRNTGFPPLSNTGVPFLYIDNEVTNGLTYFYAVTAFDINSVNSTGAANTSLESARITQRVIPRASAGNYSSTGEVQPAVVWGRSALTDTELPTIDPATGKFNKKFPYATGTTAGIATFVSDIVASGSGQGVLLFDSVTIGTQVEGTSQQVVHHFTAPATGTRIAVPLNMELTAARQATDGRRSASGSFPAIAADPELAARYGGGPGFSVAGDYNITIPSAYYLGVRSRGCVNGASSTSATSGLRNLFWGSGIGGCYYNGPRWFSGDNETMDHPNAGNAGTQSFATNVTTNFNNSGELPGVVTIHRPVAYNDRPGAAWRPIEAAFSPFNAAADYRVYWGAGGVVDSVVDLTHDVQIPFKPTFGSSWGILNASAVPAGQSFDLRPALTASDIGCVAPFKTLAAVQGAIACSGAAASLSSTAIAGDIVLNHAFGGNAGDRTAPVAANDGFGFYIMGSFFIMELQGGALPAAGTQWTLRDYIGAIRGGTGSAGAFGDYFYAKTGNVGGSTGPNHDAVFQLVTPGVSLRFDYTVNNQLAPSSATTLAQIHTVPDPYYVTSAYEATTTSKIIKFVNLPEQATIRIYTTSGVLVRMLKQDSGNFGGDLNWDVRNRNNQFVASGVYFYHVLAENGESMTGRMTIINYAP